LDLTNEELETATLKDYLIVLRRHFWLIAGIMAITLLLVLLITLKMKKMYEASATLRIEAKRMTLGVSVEEFYLGAIKARDYFNTECRTIKSRSIATRVYEKMEAAAETVMRGKSETAAWKERYSDAPEPVSLLVEDIRITPDIDSYLAKIRYRSASPDLAARVVNTVIDEYLAFKIQSESMVTEEAQRRVLRVTEDLERKFSESEKNLEKFEKNYRVGSFQKELERISVDVSTYQRELTRLSMQKAELEAKWGSFKEAGDDIKKRQKLPEVASDRLVGHYLKIMADLSRSRMAILKKHASESMEVTALDAQIEEVRGSLREAIDRIVKVTSIEYERCKQEIAQKESLLKTAQDKEKGLLQLLNEYERMKTGVETNKTLYGDYLSRKRELESAACSTPRNVEVIDRAFVPIKSVSPKMLLNLALAFIASLLGGIGFAFLLEHLDDTIRDDRRLKKAGGLGPVGTIPYIKAQKGKKRGLVTVEPGNSGAAEAFRAMMINVFTLLEGHDSKMRNEELGIRNEGKSACAGSEASSRIPVIPHSSFHIPHSSKTILVTSANPEEGKSLVCSNLAAAIAQWGKKTVIVDTDMRKPLQHRMFDVKKEKGLSDYITDGGDGDINGFIRPTPVENLSLVTSGTYTQSPIGLLGSDRMRLFISKLKERYDTILFDSPPLLGIADSMVVASSYSDAVLLVVLIGKTKCDALNHAVDLLKSTETKIIGAALNEISPKKSGYYYSRCYHRYYRSYGTHE
jgi:capsular exopolysaccharide synthesis family protein